MWKVSYFIIEYIVGKLKKWCRYVWILDSFTSDRKTCVSFVCESVHNAAWIVRNVLNTNSKIQKTNLGSICAHMQVVPTFEIRSRTQHLQGRVLYNILLFIKTEIVVSRKWTSLRSHSNILSKTRYFMNWISDNIWKPFSRKSFRCLSNSFHEIHETSCIFWTNIVRTYFQHWFRLIKWWTFRVILPPLKMNVGM